MGIKGHDMSNLEMLYKVFYKPSVQSWLNEDVDSIRKELRESLSNEDRKKVLRIVDDLTLIKEIQLKESFISGLILGLDLKDEIKNYFHEDYTEN